MDEVLHLIQSHEYFRGVGDDVLREVAGLARVTDHDTAAVVHQPDDALDSVSFVLRGRLKAVRVDSRGEESFFRQFERGEQYGLMLGGLGETLPVRVFALEPATLLTLDHERSMELLLKHPDLRRQWFGAYARSLRRHFFEATAGRAPRLLALFHESPATRGLAAQLVERLRGLGEEVCVLSDSDSWRAVPGLRFRPLSEGGRALDAAAIRQQIAEWHHANRIVADVAADQDPDRAAALMRADSALVFVRPAEVKAAIGRLRALDVVGRGWRDKIAVVWLLDEGSNVAPAVPELREVAGREFKVCASPLPSPPYGPALSAGLERLIHHLRGVRIGLALGGGAARGMAHLGALKALEQNGIVIDMIAGTSAGAMTGVFYAAGLGCDWSANQFASDLALPWLFRRLRNGGYWYLLYKYRFGQFDPMLRKYLRDWKLEQLPIPCLAVTVDLVSGGAVVRERGDAVHAILESINLPVLSLPICRDGQALIDGGMVNNVPADVLTAQGCNFVIAVSVSSRLARQFGVNTPDTPTRGMRIPSTLKTLLRTIEVQNFSLNDFGVRPAEVVIDADVTAFDLSEFTRARELAAAGERAALGQMPKLKRLLARLDPVLFRPEP